MEFISELWNSGVLYILISLCIWLTFEMSGAMANARKDLVDGTAIPFLIIVLWPLILIFIGACIVIFIMYCIIYACQNTKLF